MVGSHLVQQNQGQASVLSYKDIFIHGERKQSRMPSVAEVHGSRNIIAKVGGGGGGGGGGRDEGVTSYMCI